MFSRIKKLKFVSVKDLTDGVPACTIHEATRFFRKAGPRSPFSCSKSCSGCAPRSQYSLYSAGRHTAPSQNSLQEKGSLGAGLPERIRRFSRVGNWRADGLANSQDPFPFPATARQTGRAVFLHPAFSWSVIPSPTESYAFVQSAE